MKRTKGRMTVCLCLIGLLLCFIWGNSLLPADDSGMLSGSLAEFLGKVFPCLLTEEGEHFLRKAAHFSEFTALGLLCCWLFGMLRKKVYLPLLCGVGAACVDECLQRFSPGRACSIRDVALDAVGVLTGVMLLFLLHKLIKTRCH